MNETRRRKLVDKVFTKNDIQIIANILLLQHEAHKANSAFKIQINCFDGTSYERDTLMVFDEGDIFDIKRATSIDLCYYYLKNNIEFSITNGGYNRDGLVVSGNDRDWVNGIFIKLSEFIDAVKPQDNWFIRHKTLLYFLIALGIGKLFFFIFAPFVLLFVTLGNDPSNTSLEIQRLFSQYPLMAYLVKWWLFPWLMGLAFANSLTNWLFELWPAIEFDFGPEHLKSEKIRRDRTRLFCMLIILPILISIMKDFVHIG